MTQRRLITPGADRVRARLHRSLADRVTRLERGAVLLGQVSVSPNITIGGLAVTVSDTGGGHVDVTIRNHAKGPEIA